MNAKWYLARPGGAAVGPLRTDILVRRIREGTVSREALVWCQGMAKWLPLSTVKEVADAVREGSLEATTNPGPAPAPTAQAIRAATKPREDRAPATTRMPFGDEDSEEKTELAMSGVVPGSAGSPPSSGPTIALARPANNSTLAILPGSSLSGEPWPGAKVSPGTYDLPDSVTKIVDPRGGQLLATLPAAGISSDVVLAAAQPPIVREPLPTRIGAMNAPEASAARVGGQPVTSPSDAARDDERPPPYPQGFPGPETKPLLPGGASAALDEPVELPIAKSNVTTRLAVALVFILGLALGIFGARRVVMMRQAAQDEKAAEAH
jgi:hypothetical protein